MLGWSRAGRGALVFCWLAICSGCGSAGNHAKVSGEVKLDGAPLELGSILFTPVDGTKGIVTGGEIRNGHYELSAAKGPAVGANRVQITAVRKTGQMVADPLGPKGHMVEREEAAIAARFNTESQLKAQIQPGDNVQNFDVESK